MSNVAAARGRPRRPARRGDEKFGKPGRSRYRAELPLVDNSIAPPAKRLGVWIFGALGGLATTLVVGTRAMVKGLCPVRGLVTASDAGAGIAWQDLAGIVFGGHEIRDGDYYSSAQEIHGKTGSMPSELLRPLRRELAAASRNVVRGTLPNAGPTIRSLQSGRQRPARPLRAQIEQIRRDITSFQRRHRLSRVICVNLTSTEPPLRLGKAHTKLADFDAAIDRDDQRAVRPSAIYAYAAASLGLPFLHFTPSNSALIPAIQQLFVQNGAPFMGSDGKSGETLVKSALAPMFAHRQLKVLSWVGYNILGDRDGRVLNDRDNKSAKVQSKDALLPSILGYPLHTHVGIDYVPSLHDLKTAWDFVHFEGFLGFRMAMQFIWQGCDAILAAPLVLDLIRLADLAARRGEHGPMPQLACYFKQPFGVREHDLHRQWQLLVDYLDRVRGRRPR